jgi:hypothetical protein
VIFYEITGFQRGGFLPIISINQHISGEAQATLCCVGRNSDYSSEPIVQSIKWGYQWNKSN